MLFRSVTVAALAAGRGLLTGAAAPGRGGLASAADAVTWLATLALLACLVWVWLCVVSVTVDVLRRRPEGGRWSRHAPTGLRRVVLAGCGAAVGTGLTLGLAVPAGASPGVLHLDQVATSAARADHPGRPTPDARPTVDGLPLPSLPATAPATPVTASGSTHHARSPIPTSSPGPRSGAVPRPERPTADGTLHRVRTGESLWSITAALLGPEADAAAIAATWPAIYHANATRIGSDPDLLLPGTDLLLPASLGRTPR